MVLSEKRIKCSMLGTAYSSRCNTRYRLRAVLGGRSALRILSRASTSRLSVFPARCFCPQRHLSIAGSEQADLVDITEFSTTTSPQPSTIPSEIDQSPSRLGHYQHLNNLRVFSILLTDPSTLANGRIERAADSHDIIARNA
jgi:hypothetical protein